jgi:hypothetical protein
MNLTTIAFRNMKHNLISYYRGSLKILHGEYNKYDYLNPMHLYIENEAK